MIDLSLISSLSLVGQTLAPSSRLTTEHSTIAVFVVGVLMAGGLLAVACLAEWRSRRRAAAMRAALSGKVGPLRPGQTVLRGIVETDTPDGRAVALELRQIGENIQGKNGMQHRWTEVSRSVDARPFYLRLEDGRAVRVEPDSRVFIVDQLDKVDRQIREVRTRIAEIRHGDMVYAIGTLVEGYDPKAQTESGYRGTNAKTLVLRAENRRAMLLSTEVPTERHVRREGFHGNWALAIAALMVAVHLFAFGTFEILALTGTEVRATVVERHSETHRTKNGSYQSYHLSAQYENVSGHINHVRDELNPSAFYAPETSAGQTVSFVVSRYSSGVAQIGASPGVSFAQMFISAMLTGLLGLLYVISIRTSRPWYEKSKVVDWANGAL
jgi:hypothetical protein